VCSLLFFHRSSDYEVYFIYFIGSYGLGVLAYLASQFQDISVRRMVKLVLLLIGLIIAAASLQQIWLRNFFVWFVALTLYVWGDSRYPKNWTNSIYLKVITWGSQRSYCAFLINFTFILLANTLYILHWAEKRTRMVP